MNQVYAAVLLITAITATATALIVWRRRTAPGAHALTVVMGGFAFWAATYAFHWMSTSPLAMQFWLNMTFFGVVITPTALLVFTLEYCNRSYLTTRRRLYLFAIEPAITMILLWTDPYHGWFYGNHHSANSILQGGVWFYVNVMYSYLILLGAVVFLIARIRSGSSFVRRQTLSILFGFSIPLLASAISLSGLNPFTDLDITPFFFTLSGLIITVGLLRYRLFDLIPIALERIIEKTPDGVIVINARGIIVNLNPAAREFCDKIPASLGSTAVKTFARWPEMVYAIQNMSETRFVLRVENHDTRIFEATLTPILNTDHQSDGLVIYLHEITNHEQIKETLATSENKLRSLFSAMSDVILILDKDGRYLEIAPTNPSNLARDPLLLMGKTVFDIFPEDQANLFLDTIQSVLQTGQMVRVDYSMRVEDRLIWFAGNVSPLTEDSVTWVARDITERKVWEEELRKSEQKLRSIFSAMTDVILVFDSEGRYLEVAPTSTSGLYLTPPEILGKTVTDLLPAKTAAAILQAIQKSITAKILTRVEYSLELGGKQHKFSASVSPLTEDTVIFVAHDVTDLYQSAQALEEKESQYQELVNSLNEGICIVDLDENFVFANPTTEMFFGVPSDSLVGRNIQDFVDKDIFEFLKLQTNERKAGKSGRYDLEIIRPDGAHRVLLVSPRPQYDQNGICIGTFAVFRDITESKLAQQAVKDSETRLELAQRIAHVGNWELNLSTRRFWASEETFNIFGLEYTSPYFSFQKIYNLIVQEDRPRFARIIGDLISGEPAYDEEFRILRNGELEPRIIHGIAHKVANENGIVTKLSGVVQDITILKQTEKALEKRMLALTRPLEGGENITFDDLFNLDGIQRLQDEFAQATGVASVITQIDGQPITKPSNFCRLCKDVIRVTEKGRINCYKSDAVLGGFHPEGPNIQPCMSGGLWDAGAGISVGGHHIANWLIGQVRDETQTEEKMCEYARQIGADEHEVAAAFYEVPAMSKEKFELVAQTLFILANQLSTMAYQNVQQARFISERKQAEEALQESENKLRKLFTAMSDIIIIYDINGRYIEIAPTNTGKLYRPPEELINRTISEVFEPDIVELFMGTIQKTLKTGEMTRLDYNLTIGNANYWFSANVSPLSDDRVIWVARDITERKKVEEALQYQSNHDTLTGLFNRQYYETEIVRLQHSRLFPISIIMMDVDGLKSINDHRGHASGDELLLRVAGVLKSSFRPEDLVARMGGDEFIVVLPETSKVTAEMAVQRLKAVLAVHNSLFPSDQQLGISIGVATGTQKTLLTKVFKQADSDMYIDKSNKKLGKP